MSSTTDTIFALASAPGRAGVAVIRVSGNNAHLVFQEMAQPMPTPRQAALRIFCDPTSGEAIDQGLALWMPGPGTFTGEDTVELQGHGSKAAVAALLRALSTLPRFRLAEPGEFALRAFHNGKLDLTAAEGLADLIDAETDAQRRQALAQSTGGLDTLYEAWRHEMIHAQALMEAAIDFADEGDVAETAVAEARAQASNLQRQIACHLAQAHRGEIVRDGFKVVLAGAVNAGKSTLLNALARREVAIVSPEAGTTRDIVEARLDLGGYAVIVSDTAGLRESASSVEQEGMRRGLERARAADLVLWLQDACEVLTDGPSIPDIPVAKLLRVATKLDQVPSSSAWLDGSARTGLAISAKTGAGLAQLEAEIGRRVKFAANDGTGSQAAPTSERHRALLSQSLEHLNQLGQDHDRPPELQAEDLRLAAAALGRLTGRIDAEEVLGAIFGRFCIGK